MLDDPGGQPSHELLLLALKVLVGDRDLDRPLDLRLDPWERQAALLAELPLLLAHDLGVAEDPLTRAVVLAPAGVEHEQLLLDPDLGGGEPDPASSYMASIIWSAVRQGLVEGGDRLAAAAENGVWVDQTSMGFAVGAGATLRGAPPTVDCSPFRPRQAVCGPTSTWGGLSEPHGRPQQVSGASGNAVKRRNYPMAVKIYGQVLSISQTLVRHAPSCVGRCSRKQRKPPSSSAMLFGGFNLLIAGLQRAIAHAGAAKSLERYLAMDPAAESANLKLGDSLERAGFSKSALAIYAAYAGCSPAAWRRAALLALYYEHGKMAEALAMYEQALKVDPRDQESLRPARTWPPKARCRTPASRRPRAARPDQGQDAAEALERQERLRPRLRRSRKSSTRSRTTARDP